MKWYHTQHTIRINFSIVMVSTAHKSLQHTHSTNLCSVRALMTLYTVYILDVSNWHIINKVELLEHTKKL